jgi:hypothetical protein
VSHQDFYVPTALGEETAELLGPNQPRAAPRFGRPALQFHQWRTDLDAPRYSSISGELMIHTKHVEGRLRDGTACPALP